MTTTVAVADGIFAMRDDGPVLLGSRCTNCDNHMSSRESGCPRCLFDQQEDVALCTRGTLWTWTVQAFPPKSPPYLGPTGDDFVPHGVGYVELPNQVSVEARLTFSDPDPLEMELVYETLRTDDDGNDVVTDAFRPVDLARREYGTS